MHQVELRVGPTRQDGRARRRPPAGSAEALRREFPTLVFTPDRLSVVKGGPAVRRAYFDRVLARLHPARAGLPGDYAAASRQRNAALRRVQLGHSDRAGARAVDRARRRARRTCSSRARRETVGGARARLRASALGARACRRLARLRGRAAERGRARATPRRPTSRTGVTGLGPHRDDVVIDGRRPRRSGASARRASSGLRSSRSCSPRRALAARSPLLLLDDVLSELDARRRRRARRARRGARADADHDHRTRSALPVEPSQIVEVGAGQAR